MDPDTNSGFHAGRNRPHLLSDALARRARRVVECVRNGAIRDDHPGRRAGCRHERKHLRVRRRRRIPIGGSITLKFANVKNGPIPCPLNTLTKIYRAIPGGTRSTTLADGILGRDIETRAEFEARRIASVALNARGSLQSIFANVFAVPDVIDVYVTENATNSTVPVGETAYDLVPHSLLVSVVGGDNDAIAEAIWRKKDVGCDMNGNTTVTVVDSEGYSPPFPEYDITFLRPDALPIKFAVEIADSPSLPSDIVALTKAAIIAAFTGADGGTRVRIGSLLLASKFYPGIIRIGDEVSLISVLLGSTTATLTQQLIGVDQAPTVVESDISVTLV
jgi:hypothetical protein